MTPLLADVPAHLTNSKELLDQLIELPSDTLEKFSYPFSLDVTALYTSVPPQEAIDNAVQRLERNRRFCRPFEPRDIGTLLRNIFNNTIFSYQNNFYAQISGLPMGNAVSGILAILFMDSLEKQVLSNLTNLTLYRRYVDDSLILTTDSEEAENIHSKLNQAHPTINFEIEHPKENNSISLLDFTIKIENGHIEHEFYQKDAKARLLPHYDSAIPTNNKRTILKNEIQRRKDRCTTPTQASKHINEFKETMRINGYPENFLQSSRKRKDQSTHRSNEEYMYFEFPYVNDTVDRRIRKIFKDIDLPVRLYRKSYTLRNALRNTSPPIDQCQMKNCTLRNDLCHVKNCVYQITCIRCQKKYIGSTIRPLHIRLREHLSNNNSSIYIHKERCRANFNTKIIARENDPVKLRFKEAMLINSISAEINNRIEREELNHLIY